MESAIISKVSKRASAVRQPVSCEPCRQRKIKCSRTRPPCDSCRRRRLTDSCHYIRNRESNNGSSNELIEENQRLLDRVNSLEEILRRQNTAGFGSNSDSLLLSPPTEAGQVQSPTATASSPRGELITSAAGHISYVPRTSQWKSVLANTGLAAPILSDSMERIATENGFPVDETSGLSTEDLVAILPPSQQTEYLKNTYFKVFSPLFHILHDPTVKEEYTRFVYDPSSVSLSWLAILFILLSLAVTALEENDPILKDLARGPSPSRNIQLLAKRYRDAAMKCLTREGVFFGRHNVQSLQALVMLGYAMSHSQEPIWVLLGMTYNIAVAMGCHVDPSAFNLDSIQCEERRRCWTGLIMLYTIQNSFLGNPDPNWRISHSVHLPADANDINITVSGVHPSTPGPTQMTYLLFKFRLYNLTASICNIISTVSYPSRSSIQSLDAEISSTQECWDERYHSDTSHSPLPTHHRVHLHILQSYAHQLFLLLHRPFFAQSIIGLDIPNESQIRCITSAEALLDIHRSLCEEEEYRPYLWYTYGLGSFHAFHAAAVLAVALIMPMYRPQWRKFRRMLEEVSDRFEVAKGRSPICSRAGRILRGLLRELSGSQERLITPSPSMSSTTSAPPSLSTERMPLNTQLDLFVGRLEAQQWFGPGSMTWTEWDTLIGEVGV